MHSRLCELRTRHPLQGRELPPIREAFGHWVNRRQLDHFIQRISPFQSEAIDRGPLPFIILAETGQDVRNCANCRNCEGWMIPGMDLDFGEILRAAARNDPTALLNQSLWNCDDAFIDTIHCQQGFDIPAVIRTLRREAILRGYHKRFYRLRSLHSRITGWRPATRSPRINRERIESLRRKLEKINRFKS